MIITTDNITLEYNDENGEDTVWYSKVNTNKRSCWICDDYIDAGHIAVVSEFDGAFALHGHCVEDYWDRYSIDWDRTFVTVKK